MNALSSLPPLTDPNDLVPPYNLSPHIVSHLKTLESSLPNHTFSFPNPHSIQISDHDEKLALLTYSHDANSIPSIQIFESTRAVSIALLKLLNISLIFTGLIESFLTPNLTFLEITKENAHTLTLKLSYTDSTGSILHLPLNDLTQSLHLILSKLLPLNANPISLFLKEIFIHLSDKTVFITSENSFTLNIQSQQTEISWILLKLSMIDTTNYTSAISILCGHKSPLSFVLNYLSIQKPSPALIDSIFEDIEMFGITDVDSIQFALSPSLTLSCTFYSPKTSAPFTINYPNLDPKQKRIAIPNSLELSFEDSQAMINIIASFRPRNHQLLDRAGQPVSVYKGNSYMTMKFRTIPSSSVDPQNTAQFIYSLWIDQTPVIQTLYQIDSTNRIHLKFIQYLPPSNHLSESFLFWMLAELFPTPPFSIFALSDLIYEDLPEIINALNKKAKTLYTIQFSSTPDILTCLITQKDAVICKLEYFTYLSINHLVPTQLNPFYKKFYIYNSQFTQTLIPTVSIILQLPIPLPPMPNKPLVFYNKRDSSRATQFFKISNAHNLNEEFFTANNSPTQDKFMQGLHTLIRTAFIPDSLAKRLTNTLQTDLQTISPPPWDFPCTAIVTQDPEVGGCHITLSILNSQKVFQTIFTYPKS